MGLYPRGHGGGHREEQDGGVREKGHASVVGETKGSRKLFSLLVFSINRKCTFIPLKFFFGQIVPLKLNIETIAF